MESYIFEKGLLSKEDIELYGKLTDKYNFKDITPFIEECQCLLTDILNDNAELFKVQVYFKLKKYDIEKKFNDEKQLVYRPIHSADLKTQICMVAILNVIMFDDVFTNNTKSEVSPSAICRRRLSSLSNLIPSNFYGNLPSSKVESIFQPWNVKYQEYSDAVLKKYNQYKDNKKYTHEISLDFKDFFPSINPKHIYDYIIDKLSASFEAGDLNVLKIAVSKLLYCKITNIDKCSLREQYYGNTVAENYTKGILQGLPQGYFFGNICMIELSRCITKSFDGDAVYYVDDSVIFTNYHENLQTKIEELNTSISGICWSKEKFTLPLRADKLLGLNSNIGYKIELHSEGKSFISKLDDAHWGVSRLKLIAGEVYNINNALYLSTDENEDLTTEEKLNNILYVIDKELMLIKNRIPKNKADSQKKNTLEGYKKLLTRYRKFCLYRLKRIKTRMAERNTSPNSVKNPPSTNPLTIETFKKHYLGPDAKEDFDFFENFDKDIFEAELGLLISQSDEKSLEDIRSLISEFEANFTGVKTGDFMYYSKDIIGKIEMERARGTHTNSLSIWTKQNYKGYYKKDKNSTIKSLQNAMQVSISELSIFEGVEYTNFIYETSSRFQRKVLNAIFSQMINVDMSDSSIIQKRDNRPLYYFELRLLIYLRNNQCNTADFKKFANDVLSVAMNDNSIENIDYQIIEVLYILIAKVKDPNKVDSLILVHKLVNGLWKNGSKFMHFYTLHNSEHSIALIKNVITLVTSISYLNIKELDYYILFLACYLHDISMVIHPDLNSFCGDSTKSDLIYSECVSNISKLQSSILFEPKSKVKQHILEYFNKVYDYFENQIRDNHQKDSAAFIKKRSDTPYLKFIDNTILQIAADVSESHGYDTCEVYGRKSRAKSELFS